MIRRKLLEIHRVRVDTLRRVLEAVAAHGGASGSAIASFAGSSPRTAKRALAVLETLSLVRQGTSGGWEVVGYDQLGRGIGSNQLRQILRQALLRFRPFELLCEGLSYGESEKEASRKAIALTRDRIVDRPAMATLVEWGMDLEVLERRDGSLVLQSAFSAQAPEDWDNITSEDVESEARARLYIGRRLGRVIMNFLDQVDQELLQGALLDFRSKPRSAAEKAGQALENFLREVAADRGLDEEAKRCTGAGQLATMLKGKSVIHTNHLHWIQGLTSLRNVSGHSKDKLTRNPWKLDSESGFWSVSATLSVIRSVFEYVYNGKQVV